MGQQSTKLFQGQACELTYKLNDIDKEFNISYDPSLKIIQQRALKYAILDQVDTQLRDLPQNVLQQLQQLHNQVYCKYVFNELKNLDLTILYRATEYLQQAPSGEVEQLQKQYSIIEVLTLERQRDLDKQILILIIINILIEKLPNMILDQQQTNWLIAHMNPYNAINVVLILEILTAVCWSNDKCLEFIINAFNILQDIGKWRYNIEPLFNILEVQQNIYVIVQTCTFINSFVEAHTDKDFSDMIKEQIETFGIGVIYDDLRHKLEIDGFDTSFSTYERSIQFLYDQLYAPHHLAVDNYYLNNLDDFDPKKPLIYPYYKITEIFNPDTLPVQKILLDAQLAAYTQLIGDQILNQQQANRGSLFERQNVLLDNMRQSINQRQRVSYGGNDNNQNNINTVFNKLRNANGIPEIIELLEILNDEATGVTLVSRLIDILSRKLQEIDKQQTKLQKMQKDIDEGYKQQIIYLQNEVKKIYSQDKLRDTKLLETKINNLIQDNIRLQDQCTSFAQFKNKFQDLSAQLAEAQTAVSKAQQVDQLEQKLEEYANEIKKLKDLHKQPQLIKLQASGGGFDPPPEPDDQLQEMKKAPIAPPSTKPQGPPPPSLAPPPPPPPNALPPPPPPPPIKGGPPGPPPPPPPRIGGGPPPPPPPGFKPVPKGPQKEKCKTRVQMKNLIWNMVKGDQVGGTVFQDMNEKEIKLDIDEVEEKFAQRQSVQQPQIKQSIKKEIAKISLLSPERVKNIELILTKLKISNMTIKNAVFGCDKTILKLSIIESLLNITPNEVELQQYGEDIDRDTLGIADLFFIEISVIPNYAERLETIKASYTVLDMCNDVQENIVKLKCGFQSQLDDQAFKILIKVTLAYGKYVNGESSRGGAFGFKLDAILKAGDMKSSDNKENLLMLIVKQCEKIYGKGLLTEEKKDQIEYLAKLPLPQIGIDINEIKKIQKQIQLAIKSQTTNQLDKINQFEDLQSKVLQRVTDLSQGQKECEQLYDKLCAYYCENSKQPSDQFFQLIQKIWQCYEKSQGKLEKLLKQQQKEEERQRFEQAKLSNIVQSVNVNFGIEEDQRVRRSAMVDLQKSDATSLLAELKMKKQFKNQ